MSWFNWIGNTVKTYRVRTSRAVSVGAELIGAIRCRSAPSLPSLLRCQSVIDDHLYCIISIALKLHLQTKWTEFTSLDHNIRYTDILMLWVYPTVTLFHSESLSKPRLKRWSVACSDHYKHYKHLSCFELQSTLIIHNAKQFKTVKSDVFWNVEWILTIFVIIKAIDGIKFQANSHFRWA